MTTPEMGSVATARIGIVKSLALLAVGLLPWPVDWDKVRDVIDSVPLSRAQPRRARRPRGRLLRGLDRRPRRLGLVAQSTASQRLIGNPSGWVPFKEANVVQYRDGEFLQFELLPSVERTLFGQPFVTNQFGMHDDPVTIEKPDGTVSHRRPGLVDRNGLGRQAPGHLHQSARRVAEQSFGPPGARAPAAVRGAQLRRGGLQPDAAPRDAARQGDGVSARPGDLLGDHARYPADGDSPLRHAAEKCRPEVRLPAEGGRPGGRRPRRRARQLRGRDDQQGPAQAQAASVLLGPCTTRPWERSRRSAGRLACRW